MRSAKPRAASVDELSALAREPFLLIADISGVAGKARVLLAAPINLPEIEVLFTSFIIQ